MAFRKLRVLIVDDSLLFRETLARELSKDFGIEVIGTAEDPYAATKLINELHPDVITLDVEMPKMSGIEFLRRVLPQYPLPIVVVSSVAENVFDALDAGAVDFVTKPSAEHGGMPAFVADLIIKLKVAATAKVRQPMPRGTTRASGQVPGTAASAGGIGPAPTPLNTSGLPGGSGSMDPNKYIAIGASTGGTDALYAVLTGLPADIPGIVVVQHMPTGFTKLFADRLNSSCKFAVKEAQDGDVIRQGQCIIAAGDHHLKVQRNGSGYSITSRNGEKVSGHCPSVDAMFTSIAENADCTKFIGVILTGMGRDGADGMLKMRNAGAYTIGQDEATAIVYGMPKVAYDIGAVQTQLPLQNIAADIIKHASK